MKGTAILLVALFFLILPLSACGYSQAELDDAYQQGFAEGLTEGYTLGLQDCSPLINGENLYVGSINSDVYHYPWCEWAQKINPENEIWFNSAEEAHDAGYRPCKVCNPPEDLGVWEELLEGD
jgi:hypothetical protein